MEKRDYEQKEIAELKALNKSQFDALKITDAHHRAELEKRSRLEWRAHQEKLKELNDAQKMISMKDKELAQLNGCLLLKQSECDKLEDEIKRLKGVELWQSSQSSETITKRERDMAMRNSELSFRIRTLEDNIHLKEQKQTSHDHIATACSEITPLKDSNRKLKIQSYELNGILRSREKKLHQLSQELLDIKAAYQQLQEEYEKQRKNLKHHINQSSEYRTQNQRLMLKNEKQKESYKKLCERAKELEYNNTALYEQSISFSLPRSPPPTPCGDDSLSISSNNSQLQEQMDQLEFDRDELQAKYDEMKTEYKEVREKYKAVREWSQQVKTRHDDSILQVQRKFSFERLALEKEVLLLRREREENLIDQERQSYIIVAQEAKIMGKNNRIEVLENFIIEQDELMTKNEKKMRQAYDELSQNFDESRLQTPESNPVESGSSLQLMTSEDKYSSNVTSFINDPEELASIEGDDILCGPNTTNSSGNGSERVSEYQDLTKFGITTRVNGDSEFPLNANEKWSENERSSSSSFEDSVLRFKDTHENVLADNHMTIQKKSDADIMDSVTLCQTSSECQYSLPPSSEQTLDHYGKAIQDLQESVRHNVAKLKKKEKEAENLNNLLSEARDQRAELNELLEKLEEQLTNQVKLNESQSQQKDNIIDNLRYKLANMNREITRINGSQITEDVQIEHLQNLLSEAQDEILKMNDLQEKLKEELKTQKEVQSEEKDIINDLNSKIAYMNREMMRKIESQVEGDSGVELTKKLLAEAQDENDELNDSLEKLKQRMKNQEELTESQSEARDNIIEDLRSKITYMNKELRRMVESQVLIEKLLSEAQDENLQLNDSLERLKEKSKSQEELNKSQSEEGDSIIEDLRSKLTCMNREMVRITESQITEESRDVQIEHLQKLLSEAKNEKLELNDLLEKLKGQLKNLEESQSEKRDNTIDDSCSKLAHMNREMMTEPEIPEDEAEKLAHDIGITLRNLQGVSPDLKLTNKLNTLREEVRDLCQLVFCRDVLEDIGDEVRPWQSHKSKVQHENDEEFKTKVPKDNQQGINHNMGISRVFVVVMDYDPQSLCITGHPELELHLLSGSVISVVGEMDENGYYTATYNNKEGIVPANFIQEIELLDDDLINRLSYKDKFESFYMEELHSPFDMQSVMCRKAITLDERLLLHDQDSRSKLGLEMTTVTPATGSSNCLEMDSAENPCYKMYIGLYDYDPLTSSSSANPEFELSIKEGSLIKIFGKEMSDGYFVGELHNQRGLVPANFIADASAMDKTPLIITSKTMIALYDYRPERDSPNLHPDMELTFNSGDHIIVYGIMHGDGFYSGELNGKLGLVPSNFIKETES